MFTSGNHESLLHEGRAGRDLDGREDYKLRVAADVPSSDCWRWCSITRGFRPEAPEGKESNWLQTVPGKAWHRAFRNHGLPEGWFDKSRKLYDIECMD